MGSPALFRPGQSRPDKPPDTGEPTAQEITRRGEHTTPKRTRTPDHAEPAPARKETPTTTQPTPGRDPADPVAANPVAADPVADAVAAAPAPSPELIAELAQLFGYR